MTLDSLIDRMKAAAGKTERYAVFVGFGAGGERIVCFTNEAQVANREARAYTSDARFVVVVDGRNGEESWFRGDVSRLTGVRS